MTVLFISRYRYTHKTHVDQVDIEVCYITVYQNMNKKCDSVIKLIALLNVDMKSYSKIMD